MSSRYLGKSTVMVALYGVIYAASVVCGASLIRHASAEEVLRIAATAGDWAMMTHQPSTISRVDMCMMVNQSAGVLLRADADRTEVRVFNRTWSLPAHVEGTIRAKVGALDRSYDIDDNTDQLISAPMDRSEIKELLDAMDQASSMTVFVGKAPPISVSLSGSTKVANAFRTCAQINGNSATPGSNPFR